MNIKTATQIDHMTQSGKILAIILDKLEKFSKPKTPTIEIENYCQKLLNKYKVKGAFKDFNDYKYNTCISINHEVVHGLPGRTVLQENDIVSIDCGVIYKGYYSDSAITFYLGKAPEDIKSLINTTKESLDNAIKHIKPGVKLGTIQSKIQEFVHKKDLSLVKDLTGHGIGKNLQESPQIPNFGKENTGIILKPGMTFCLEPMVCTGSGEIAILDDGWTIITKDFTPSAHFEHTILVTDSSHKILTKI